MTTSQLDVRLPQAWQIVDPHDPNLDAWEQLDEPLASALRELMQTPERLELAAGLFSALTDEQGNPTELLIAGLTAASYDTGTMPEHVRTQTSAALVNRIPFAEQEVSLLMLTIPVTSDDGQTTVLLNFATPNLTRAEEFEKSFRDIAATATVHNNG